MSPRSLPEAAHTLLAALFPDDVMTEPLRINVRGLIYKAPKETAASRFVSSVSALHATSSVDELWAWNRDQDRSVYVALGLRRGPEGKKKGVAGITAFWTDQDAKDFLHEDDLSPAQRVEGKRLAWTRLRARLPARLQPSLVIDTGGGLQSFWLLKEPAWLDDYAVARLEGYLKGLADVLTGDPAVTHLAALMRVPGFANRKYPDGPIATIVEMDLSRRFNPHEFDEYWVEVPETTPRTEDAPATLLGPLAPVLATCGFLQWCRDHPAEVREPLWYAMFSNLVRLEGGREAGHAFSRGHPGYSAKETDAKLDQAHAAPGPTGCQKIQKLGFSGCPAGGHGVHAPAWLAWPEKERRGREPVHAHGAAPPLTDDAREAEATPAEPRMRDADDEPVGSITAWRPEEDTEHQALLALVHPAHFVDLVEPTELRLGWWCRRFRGDVLRFSPQEGWRTWTGRVWAKDETRGAAWGAAVLTVRILHRLAATLGIPDGLLKPELGHLTARAKRTDPAPTDQDADASLRARAQKALLDFHRRPRLEAVLAIAAAEPPIRIDIAAYDRDGWALTVDNGTLDLTTGTLRPHRPEDLITKLAPVAYDPAAIAPTWTRFLERVQPEADLRAWLQKRAGYMLTADAREQDLELFIGLGSNGKTTYLVTLQGLLGEYATSTRAETLLEKKGDTIPNDVAALRGARFVYATEPDVRKRLAEALLKRLTGGDPMVARFLHHEYFQFTPTFKVVLNHQPILRGTEHALWRRIRLVPWDIRIPDAEQDKTLVDTLATERPGILRWAVEGCLRWQRTGLAPPPRIRQATQRYRRNMDPLGRFLAEECVRAQTAEETAATLYRAYGEWAHRAGERAMTKTALGIALGERGFESKHASTGQVWHGLRLRLSTEAVPTPPPETDDPTRPPTEVPPWVTTADDAADDAGGADDAN